MQMCNLFTGNGFDLAILGSFSVAWIGLVILVFLNIFGRRWVGEEMSVPYNFIGGFVGAIIPYFIVVSLTCSPKISLLIGLIGLLAGSIGAGYLFNEGGGF